MQLFGKNISDDTVFREAMFDARPINSEMYS